MYSIMQYGDSAAANYYYFSKNTPKQRILHCAPCIYFYLSIHEKPLNCNGLRAFCFCFQRREGAATSAVAAPFYLFELVA